MEHGTTRITFLISFPVFTFAFPTPLIPPFFFPETRTVTKVPVYVMLPLDLLVDNTVNDPSQLLAWFQQCAAAKVGARWDGVLRSSCSSSHTR